MSEHKSSVDIAVEMLKKEEGFRPHAYKCAAGVWTVGYGTTGRFVGQATVITPENAVKLLEQTVTRIEHNLKPLIKVPLTPNQHAALMVFIYNIGITAFHASTFLRKLNEGDYQGAADQFLVWDHAKKNGIMHVIPGLSARRKRERELFLGDTFDA